MARNPGNSTTPPRAGVGPRRIDSAVSSESGGLSTGDTLIWNDIDFSGVIPSAFASLAIGTSPSAGRSMTNLQSMPTEVLIEIAKAMSPADRVSAAFAYPDLFINSNRYHVFYDDAIAQLAIPTYILSGPEHNRQPLLLEAISHGYSVEQIGFLLDLYEEVCVASNVDRHTFLNSSFPDNRPEGYQPPSPPPNPENPESNTPVPVMVRNLFSPLHVAIASQRLDIVRYLMQRGADLEHIVTRPTLVALTPLQYALNHLSPTQAFFAALSQSQRDILMEIASEILNHSPNLSAYTTSLVELSREMFLAMRAGAESIVLTLLERAAPPIDLPLDATQRLQTVRNRALQCLARSQRPMPRALLHVLNEGAVWDHRHGSATGAAIEANNVQHAVISLRWEIVNNSSTLAHSIQRICRATSGANIAIVQALVQVLVEYNQEEAQLRVLLSAMNNVARNEVLADGQSMRDMVLRTIPLNDTALRFAICFRDRSTTAHMVRMFVERGRSIDDRLPRDSLLAPPACPGHWFETPLTYALALNNYCAASQLLSFGASPSRVPANIRHRVRTVRHRINSGMISHIEDFLFQIMDTLIDGSRPTIEEAREALGYVFAKMLDDPEHPLPHYNRTLLYPEREADHPYNDSDSEDYPHRARCISSVRFGTAPWR
ncbi:hypothetical protein F5B22DRAFT_654400 [Xylaria bambusicola]|uniref:uncharacterized protein n=1 Tax=Xylaria bambusicola TaxID=326684 RepID=UPI0020087F7F|nr:uncharacterized protein F5B22DRAFT_654400 [Xylaria bambusicola]KAI0518081.1 hypothetical protein F5B22DRAFT_654400 [Xylaria bambusicola]